MLLVNCSDQIQVDERQRVLTAEVQMVGQVLLLLLLTKTEICLGAEIDLNSGASLII